MSWHLQWAAPALRDMRRLDAGVRERVHRGVRRYVDEGLGDVKKLQGLDEYRLRVGDWRVRFTLEPSGETMTILRVLPRGSAYRR